MFLDAAAGGALMGKSVDAAKRRWPLITITGPVSELHQRGPVEFMELMLWICLPARLIPLRSGWIGLGLLQGAKWGVLQVLCLRLGYYVRYVASNAILPLGAVPPIRGLSMPMPCKTSTLAYKITPTQTHKTQLEKSS